MSALNPLNAFPILARDSGSFVIVLCAEVDPVNAPVSPPKKTPAMEKNAYAAISPPVVGLRSGVISGIASMNDSGVSQPPNLGERPRLKGGIQTFSPISKLHMRRLLLRSECIEDFDTLGSDSVGQSNTESQADE